MRPVKADGPILRTEIAGVLSAGARQTLRACSPVGNIGHSLGEGVGDGPGKVIGLVFPARLEGVVIGVSAITRGAIGATGRDAAPALIRARVVRRHNAGVQAGVETEAA